MKEFGSHFSLTAGNAHNFPFMEQQTVLLWRRKTTKSVTDTLSFVTDKTNINAKWALFVGSFSYSFLLKLFAMVLAIFTVQSFQEEWQPIQIEKQFR